MTNLIEAERWEDGVYQLETSDPVVGGPDGIDNLQAKQLANRTRYLKRAIETGQSDLEAHVAAGDPHPQYATHADLAEKVAALVAQAPETLDTLSELAKALGNDPSFATTITNALALKAALDSPAFAGTPTTPMPPVDDDSLIVTNTAWVKAQNYQPALGFTPVQQGGGTNQGDNKVKIGWSLDGSGLKCMVDANDLGNFVFDGAVIGQIVFEPRTQARVGFLKCNGALIKRTDYPKLWAYAQASGALVTDAAWAAGSNGCFSQGNGATTFRLPELRGEFLRCWDDGRGADASRGIGTWQGSQNVFHAHGASSGAAGAHGHSAWTDTQGWHGHHGATAGAGAHSHQLAYNTPQRMGDVDRGGNSSVFSIDNEVQPWTSVVGDHAHVFDTEGAGNHAHNVGIGAVGDHIHAITVNGDGGNEARPRNLALLAMIRAY
ncbi:hypothetical protein FAZ69_22625 [Trinickia terrae]|uniref:Phage tail collar domain-containing protein n=1 Tax=Trinickia terrae TaxID=2571161 RepID=A0A4U1HR82_9BURK|nr:phage tail protein [Trinickia terrae]TKC83831.1 hypothetical protein FAZ69_22625 [Trinickia terrae]